MKSNLGMNALAAAMLAGSMGDLRKQSKSK